MIADSGSSASIASKLRDRRFSLLRERFPDIDSMRVLDLGGTVSHWASCPWRPGSVVTLNIFDEQSDHDWITPVRGDACDPLSAVRGDAFDLVYSNSVIEHLGGHERRCRFAEAVHAVAKRHWIQTPNRYFPLEPHWLFPGLQFLPTGTRAAIVGHWPLSPARPRPKGRQAVADALEIELLTKTHMRFYFPDSEILDERVFLASKSIIAVTPD